MNKRIFLVFASLFFSVVFAQNPADYFPNQINYKWYFEVTALDSLNNPEPDMSYLRIDEFIGEGNYFGRNSRVITSNADLPDTLGIDITFDSTFVNFENNNALLYFSLAAAADSSILPDTGLIPWLQSFTDWYPLYQFDLPVGLSVTLFQRDTTISFDGTDVPIRIKVSTERENDETLQTVLGSLDCKKFTVTASISVLIGFPPFVVPIELVAVPVTSWMAPGLWVVEELRPSVTVDLGAIGLPSFYLPGSQSKLTTEPTSVDEQTMPEEFYLSQNYPNPFNPLTNISFVIPSGVEGFSELKVYDILGNEISTLLKENLSSGKYEIQFDGINLPSGVYFYTLDIGGQFRSTKKMLLLK